MSKFLTKDSIASDGVLIARKIKGFAFDHVFIYGCFRLFYALDGGSCSPQELADRNADAVPDYVESMLYKLETARILFTESFHLKDPLLSGFFHEQGAKFIDVYLGDISREHGLASGVVYDESHEILAASCFQGKSLKITLHRNLKAQTETPLHELFHLFQYNYSQFNNPWFMEGLGRWSQRIISDHSGKEVELPSSSSELDELLTRSHEAEYFWNRLSSLCDQRGTFVIPGRLSHNDEIANNIRCGAALIKTVLENLQKQGRLIKDQARLQKLNSHVYWPRDEKRSPANNRYILRAIYGAINSCVDIKSDELTRFINVIKPYIIAGTADFDTPEIQTFMLALGKCSGDYVKVDANGILYSDCFDLFSGTLSTPTLDFSSPGLNDFDLDAFKVVKHVNGNLRLNNFSITHLDGFDNIESITGSLVLENSGISCIEGLSKLRTVSDITLSGMDNLMSVCGFNNLQIVANSIYIANNASLCSINGFNSLEESGTLEIVGNSSLESISGFNHLEKLNGDLLLSKCKKLKTLAGISSLCSVNNILIAETSLADCYSLRNVFRKRSDFPGYIKIISNSISSVSFMRGLRSVGSSFYLHQNKLSDLSGLEALEIVGASLSLGSNRLNDISQLSNLRKINGILSLSDNCLISLRGLENLQSIRTTTWNGTRLTIKLQGNKYSPGGGGLADISALSSVKEVGENLVIWVDPDRPYQLMPLPGSVFYSNKIAYCTSRSGEEKRSAALEIMK